jgi:nucleoside-diphosphate-sugar epimerase
VTVLVSGATGQLGAAVAEQLAGSEARYVLRPAAGRSPHARLQRLGHVRVAEDRVLAGDVTAPRWGLDEHRSALGDVDCILHLAAETNWSAPWRQLYGTNVGAVHEAVALAGALAAEHGHEVTVVAIGSALATYGSAPWVGEHRHPLYERALPYERSKWQGEGALLDGPPPAGVRRALVRVTSVIGDAGQPGRGRRQGPYLLLDAAARTGRRWLVANPRARVDLVPRDLAAAALVELVARRDRLTDGFIGHLCLGETAPTVATLVAALNDGQRLLGRPPFRLLPLPESGMLRGVDAAARLVPLADRNRNSLLALRYVALERLFGRERLGALLPGAMPNADVGQLARILLGTPVAGPPDRPGHDPAFDLFRAI